MANRCILGGTSTPWRYLGRTMLASKHPSPLKPSPTPFSIASLSSQPTMASWMSLSSTLAEFRARRRAPRMSHRYRRARCVLFCCSFPVFSTALGCRTRRYRIRLGRFDACRVEIPIQLAHWHREGLNCTLRSSKHAQDSASEKMLWMNALVYSSAPSSV